EVPRRQSGDDLLAARLVVHGEEPPLRSEGPQVGLSSRRLLGARDAVAQRRRSSSFSPQEPLMSYAGIGTTFTPPGSPGYKAYWDAKARECMNMADEGTCLAQVARHVPVTISGLGLTFLPPGSPEFKAYWKQRAAACQGMANKGACLARVARNAPVTI